MSNTDGLSLPNALAFAGRGHGILPLFGIVAGKCDCGNRHCKSPGKHPYGKLAPNGLKNASTDRKTIRTWFAEVPNINYGVITDNLPTVDIDPRNDGDKAWLRLVRKNYLPHTWEVVTGGGGRHIIFGSISKPARPFFSPFSPLIADNISAYHSLIR